MGLGSEIAMEQTIKDEMARKEADEEIEGEARREKEEMPRKLPIVKYEGKLWIFDEKLRQLRNLYTPHDLRDLNDFEVDFFANGMTIPIPVYDFDGEWETEELKI